MKVKSLSRVQLFATAWTVHGIFQARILEWAAISFSRGSSWPRDQTQVSRTVGRCFTIWATREVPKRLLMKVKVESEKVGLNLNIQKTKIMASGPITSWEKMGKQWKQCQTLFLGAPKQCQTLFWGAYDGGCSCEIKRRLLLGRKVMTNLDSILKSRDITLLQRSI